MATITVSMVVCFVLLFVVFSVGMEPRATRTQEDAPTAELHPILLSR